MTSDHRADPSWVARASRVARALAGPVLIAGSVVLVLWDFAFRGLLSAQHPDLIQAWLPFHCFLGKSLAAGHIPAWNPYAAAGAPFAADPQSGWMYLPAMGLYAAASCHTALGLFLVLQPVLGGLGLYWFLRAEGLSRAAATAGSLVLALMISGSTVVLELPFSASLAWTALTLAAAARCFRASTWPGRLGWIAACAVCWGQIAAAHLSHGLVVGTGALVTYLAAGLLRDVHREVRPGRQALALAGLIALALPLVNAAVLFPRLAYLPRTTLALGYDGLAVRAAHMAGRAGTAAAAVSPHGLTPTWPFVLLAPGGAYLGVVASVLSLGALWDRRLRSLAVGFVLYGAAGYALSLRAVDAKLIRPLASVPFVDFYQHAPIRLAHATRVAIAVLVGLGVEAWRRAPGPGRRALMLASGLALWWVGAALVGELEPGTRLLAIGLGGGSAALALSAWRPRFVALVPAVVALELGLNGVWGASVGASARPDADQVPHPPPTVAGAAYVQPQPIERFLRSHPGARYATLARGGLEVRVRSELVRSRSGWNAAADQRSMLFGLEDVDVYNPTQSIRYWSFVRAVSAGLRQPKYNTGYFTLPRPAAFDLLDVGWVVAPAGARPAAGERPRLTSSGWTLFRLPSVPPRASVYGSWTRATTPDDALAAVSAAGFDPPRSLVVERWPAGASGGHGGTANYEPTGPQSARISVTTSGPSILLVRNSYDPNWRAWVDGRPAPVLPADYVDQGIPVPAGTHVVELRYEDRTIGLGLLVSALALAAMLVAALSTRSRFRRPADSHENRSRGKQKRVRNIRAGRGRINARVPYQGRARQGRQLPHHRKDPGWAARGTTCEWMEHVSVTGGTAPRFSSSAMPLHCSCWSQP